MRQDTTEGYGGADQSIELLISADRELEMARCDALDLEILGSVAGKFENLSGEVLEDSCDIDSSFGADAHLVLSVVLEETLDTTARELVTIHQYSVVIHPQRSQRVHCKIGPLALVVTINATASMMPGLRLK